MPVKDYRELVAWQKAMDLVEATYRVTARFPKEELYGLSSQIRKAAVSIPSNIAEGQGRSTTRDFLNFLSVASGSLNELLTQIAIAGRLGYIDEQRQSELTTLATEVRRLVSGLAASLRRKLS